MDDVTNKRFDRVEQKIEGVEQELRDGFAAVRGEFTSVRTEMREGLAAVVKGFDVGLAAVSKTIERQYELLIERSDGERDRRLKALEDEVAALRTMIVTLMGAGKQ